MLHLYERLLSFVLRHQPITLGVTLATAVLSVYLYVIVPKGFFPQQDTGRLTGNVRVPPDVSFAVTPSPILRPPRAAINRLLMSRQHPRLRGAPSLSRCSAAQRQVGRSEA